MKPDRYLAAALIVVLLAACAGPEARIEAHRRAFESYPPSVQEKIRKGEAEVGFTKEQVAMALGRPGWIYSRKTSRAEQEVWVYGLVAEGPRDDVGFGMGPSGPGFYDAGVGLGPDEEELGQDRVVFQDGRVVSVENRWE